MLRISRRAALYTITALFSLLIVTASQAAPYYVSWEQLYDDSDSTRSQTPSAIAVDSRGNVFVTGAETAGNGVGLYVAKYDGLDGHLIWQRRISSGTTIFQMNAIAVDSKGDVVVTGSRNAGGIDYYTIKLKGTDGTNFWAAGSKIFDGANAGQDIALKVVCDGADDVIITGQSVGQNGMGNSTAADWVTIKYDRDDAVAPIVSSYTQSTSNLDDIPSGLAVDSSNNIYITGTVQTGVDFRHLYVRKLSGTTLAKLWDNSPINTGTATADAEGGGTAIAVDANNSIVVTSRARDGANHFGYFTIKYNSSGQELWRTSAGGPFSQGTFGTPYANSPNRTPRAQPIGVSIGLDNNPIITGTLLDANGTAYVRTVKYTSGGFMLEADEFWDTPSIDTGLGFGNTIARAISADDAGNAIVLGETQNADGDTDVFVSKCDTQTGARIFFQTFNRSETNPSQDKGVDVATDRLGNIAALGTFIASKNGSPGAGNNEFGTIKLNRLIVPTGDDLPDFIPGVADNAKVKIAGTPSISTAGPLATKLTFKAGNKTSTAILVESRAAGGTSLPAVKGQPAPLGAGAPAANWVSFSDPIVAPNGTYAFAAKVSGPASTANGVWANLNGTLKQVFRQGSLIPVTGSTDKFASVTSFGISSNNLIALVKLAGPATSNIALIRVDQTNAGTILLRTGQTGLMLGGVDHTVKGITIFSPAPLEAGDGRWVGPNGVVVRVAAVETATPANKATAVLSILNAGAKTVVAFSGQPAASPVASASYAAFGFPSTAFGSSRFAYKSTLTPGPAATNSALIYHFDTAQSTAFAQKGVATGIPGLPAGVTYADFSDPIVNSNSATAFIATLKGTPQEVKPTTNKAIVLRTATSNLGGTLALIARTGDAAKDSAGNDSTLKWTAFTALALPGGTNAGPIFVGKLNAPKNNLGLWAVDSKGKIRQLLRQGDKLDTQTVKKFTLLNTVSKVPAAARSFDGAGSVAVFITFTDGKTAIQRIGIP